MLRQLISALVLGPVHTAALDIDARAAPANPAAVITSPDGKARFTVLAPELLRLEFSESSTFDDRQSLSFVNRALPVPPFNHSVSAGVLRLQTESLLLTYAAAAPPPPTPQPPADFCTGMPDRAPICTHFPPHGPDGGNDTCVQFRSRSAPNGLAGKTADGCCSACLAAEDCTVWAHTGGSAEAAADCYLLTSIVSATHGSGTLGGHLLPAPARGFSTGLLRVQSFPGVSPAFDWRWGQMDSGNLLGTATALDSTTGSINLNCSAIGAGDNRPNGGMKIGCDLGPLSRDGWAVLEDSHRPRLEPSTQWVTPPPPQSDKYTDLYFFGYGHRYKEALKGFTSIAGPAQMPPRFALGVWWSRYWPYTAEDLEDIARGYASHSIPLDVLVSDMAWHYHGESKVAWGGYSWGKQLFPNPSKFLDSVAKAGLNLTLNLHLEPVDPANEERSHYEAFVTKLGFAPEQRLTIPSAESKPFTGTVAEELTKSKRFAGAYLELLDRMGTNFWWLDDTPDWIARLLYEHSATRMERGLAFARWAGLGSHRYPIGFSGDTYMEWSTLQFQPEFTATASNVLYYWSHDIGGHRSTPCNSSTEPTEQCQFGHTAAAYNPELYLRWVQWGAHSPILRTHPQPDPKVERRAWGYSLPWSDFMRAAFARRARLVPALYTANHDFETSSVAALRPLYYDYQELDGAYEHRDTYLFVDGLLVAPVTSAQNNRTELADRSLWLPPAAGDSHTDTGGAGWIDTESGVEFAPELLGAHGLQLNHTAALFEIPVFAKAGAMIPMALQPGVALGSFDPSLAQPAIGGAAHEPVMMSWEVWVGSATTGQGHVWEESRGTTNVSFALSNDAKSLTLRVHQLGTKRRHRFELQNLPPAASMAACTSSTEVEPKESSYDGRTLALNIHSTVHSGVEGGCIILTFSESLTSSAVVAARGIPYRNIRQRLHVLKQRFDDLVSRPGPTLMPLVAATNTAERMTNLAVGSAGGTSAWATELSTFGDNVNSALLALRAWAPSYRKDKEAAMALLHVAEAWICKGAAGRLDLPAC